MELQAPERELLDRLQSASIRIPPRPQILHDIETMLQDDNSTQRMIGQLIARDVSLTAEVFKLVNSAFYRRGAKIESLEQAVSMLGRKPMAHIARAALLRQQLGGNLASMESFWERCTDIGTICSALLDQLDLSTLSSEQAYLAGLFHDCGVPVLMQHIQGYGAAQLGSPTGPDFLAEDDAHHTSHCIAGLMVATEWQLPDALCDTIRCHHYALVADQPAAASIALLQLALHAYACNNGWPDAEWEYHEERALQTLALEPSRVDAVIGEALASFDVLH